MHDDNSSATAGGSNGSPLSLNRLREAFAAMLGTPDVQHESRERPSSPQPLTPSPTSCEVNPRSVVEAILFVGRPDNRGHSARELAAAMRGVSPGEIEAAIGELNSLYDADAAPYHIDGTSGDYRLVLRKTYERFRDKFHGRAREARLSPSAIEVLSIIAYNQPITGQEINQLREAANGAALSTLVRRRLVKLERPQEGGAPRYSTTERFLKLFGLESVEALPRSDELEKAS
jgi:segregation and condensation protein B